LSLRLDYISYVFILFSLTITYLIISYSHKEISIIGGVGFIYIIALIGIGLVVVFLVVNFLYFYFVFESSLVPIFLIIIG
jgi:NADH:ubiquinone oxidoreductase subunit 4 (subunit M)